MGPTPQLGPAAAGHDAGGVPAPGGEPGSEVVGDGNEERCLESGKRVFSGRFDANGNRSGLVFFWVSWRLDWAGVV